MKTIYECSMSKSIKWISIALIIVILVAMVALLYDIIYKDGTASNAIGILVLFLMMLSVFCLYPQYIISDEEGIGIHSLLRTKWVKYEDIDRLERANVSGSIRICGIGGFFGRIGLYRNSKMGTYISYVTDSAKAFAIYRKTGKPVVFSVSDPDSFLPYFLKN